MEIKKQTKLKDLMKNEYFNNLFDYELINYITKITKDDNEKYKALKSLYFDSVLTFNDFKNIHSKDNNLKIWKGTRFGWSENLTNFMKGSSYRGKNRPEHSNLMKIKMKGIDRGDSFRKTKKEQNSSIDFKIKVLTNKNIDVLSKSENEINDLYKLIISNARKTNEFKIKKVKKFLKSNKYLDELIFLSFKNKFENVELCNGNIEKIYSEMMSIISTISMVRNENMGKTKFFKTGFIKVKNCLNKTIIRYRSSWELKTIEFLELNEIKYSYESFYIQKEDGTLYLPDFLIEYEEQKILLEIKGFIRGKKGKINEEMKIKAAKKYCKENNIKYVYLKKVLTNINEIIN
jgi:hypothetical protein